MKKLLFLTNPNNGAFEEDAYLSEKLKEYYDVIISHPFKTSEHLSKVDGVLIRNVWPTHEYLDEWKKIKQYLKESGVPTYNPLTGKGDNRGKKYLSRLFKKGFPVIPSIENLDEIDQLPASQYYWIKPLDGCDGSGSGKFTKKELKTKDLKNYIIQPYEEFSMEPSLFFIDNEFAYAIIMPNRLEDRDVKVYTPTKEDLEFAQKFIGWDNLKYGIERIDAVLTKDGKLLLTEDEDIAEYLYLFDLPENLREQVTTKLIESILKII
jgi:hypothetical protein